MKVALTIINDLELLLIKPFVTPAWDKQVTILLKLLDPIMGMSNNPQLH